MSGESESPPLTVEDRVKKLDAVLDEYETQACGLRHNSPVKLKNEAMNLLEIEPEELRRMTAEECGEAAVILNSFAFHLQRAVNREMGRAKWADASVKKAITHSLGQQRGQSFEERRLLAIANDEAAAKLDQIGVQAQLRIERLSYLAAKAESVAKSFMGLQSTRR